MKIKKYVLFLVLVGFLVYANSLGNGFVWDDEEMVVKNTPFFQLENIPSLFTQATFYSGGGSSLSGWFYRPLVMTSFLLTKIVFGPYPLGFHLVQIAFHLISSVLVFFVFRELFFSENKKLSNPLSFILALIFAVHPANVESVAYIASVAEPLYTLFLLLLFWQILKQKKFTLMRNKSLLIILLFLLALLTKEGALVFLPILFLYIFLFQKKKLSPVINLLLTGLLGYLFIRFAFFGIQMGRPAFLAPIGQASFGERLLTLPFILLSFLKTFFFPKILSISQHTVIRQVQDPSFSLSLIVVALFFLSSLLFLFKKRSRLALFFFVWFIVSLAPVVNVVMALDMTFAERWLYFPMIGLLGFLGTVILSVPKINKASQSIFIIFLGVAALLGVRTMIRNRDWKDGFTLYSHDIKIHPESFDLQNNLGVELFRRGEKEKALFHFVKSVELQPKWTISNNNLGAVYENLEELEKAENYYKKSVELGDYYLAYENYALLLVKQERYQEAEDFLKNKALKKFPKNQKLLQIYYFLLNKENLTS